MLERCDLREGERPPTELQTLGRSAFPSQESVSPLIPIHEGGDPACPSEKGLVMCSMSAFPRVHLLLLLRIVLKRQTNPINYKKHKPEIQRNKECTIRAQSLPSPDCPRTPQSLGSLWKLEAAPFPHYSVIKYVHTRVSKVWRPPREERFGGRAPQALQNRLRGLRRVVPKQPQISCFQWRGWWLTPRA